MTDLAEIDLGEVEAILARRRAGKGKGAGHGVGMSLAARRAAESTGMKAQDGRVTSGKPNDAGLVQLNVRVTPDVKDRVVRLARATDATVGGIVEAALKSYFETVKG
jgi:hypothetical protein